MENYNEDQLAGLIKQIIDEKYSDSEYFYSQLKANINRKVKSLSPQDLTENELKEKGIKVANSVIKDLWRISSEMIKKKLSKEIIEQARTSGIDLKENRDYFFSSAKERVKELLDFQYQQLKKEINKRKRKK